MLKILFIRFREPGVVVRKCMELLKYGAIEEENPEGPIVLHALVFSLPLLAKSK